MLNKGDIIKNNFYKTSLIIDKGSYLPQCLT